MTLPQTELFIKEESLLRAQKYAELVKRVECMGFFGSSPNSPIIDTIILAQNQHASGSHVSIDAQSVLAAGREFQRRGKKPRGWWHSHADFAPFHSHTDDQNTADLLNQLSAANWFYHEEAGYTLMDDRDGRLCFTNDRGEILELTLDPALAKQLAQSGAEVRRKVPVGMAYSLVVNACGSTPHAELHMRTWCSLTETAYVSKQVVPIHVVPLLDEVEMLSEIEANVHYDVRPSTSPLVSARPFVTKDVAGGGAARTRMAETPIMFIQSIINRLGRK